MAAESNTSNRAGEIGIQLSLPNISDTISTDEAAITSMAAEIREMPLDDVPHVLTIANKKLTAINRSELNGTQRALLSQAYDEIYGRIATYYESFFQSDRFGEETHEYELRELSNFTQELSYAYKHILTAFADSTEHDQEKAIFCYMAIYYIGQFMLQSYDRYTWISPVLWRELHELYTFAETNGYLGRQKHDPTQPLSSQTISDLYAEICTLALADPYHLRPGDNWVLFNYLKHWSEHVEILPPLPSFKATACFGLDVSSGQRPMAQAELEGQDQSKLRWLSVSKFLDLIDLHRDQINQGQDPSSIGLGERTSTLQAQRILDTLIDKLSAAPGRKEPRHPQQDSLHLIWNLADIHNYLSPESRRDSVLKGHLSAQKFSSAKAISTNMSKSGLCVSVLLNDVEQDLVGNLSFALRKGPNGIQTRLGSVAWCSNDGASTATMGLSLMPGKAQAIYIKALNSDMPERKGLLLVVSRPYGSSIDSLLTPTDLFEIGDWVELIVPNASEGHLVKLNTLLARGSYYEQYKFEAVTNL